MTSHNLRRVEFIVGGMGKVTDVPLFLPWNLGMEGSKLSTDQANLSSWVVQCKPNHVVTARRISPSISSNVLHLQSESTKLTSNLHSLKIMWWWGKSVKFDPDQDIGDLAEKVILVTGGMPAFKNIMRLFPV